MKKLVSSFLAIVIAMSCLLTACAAPAPVQSAQQAAPSEAAAAPVEAASPAQDAAPAEKVVLKLHHAQPTTHPFDAAKQHPYQVAAEFLADYVNEQSGGALQIEIYPANALGQDEEVLELMREGIVDMSLVMPVSKAAALIPEMSVFNFPFLFVSSAHGEAFAKTEDAKTLLAACVEHDLYGAGFSTFLFRYPINSKRDCASVADFKGLQLRTMDAPAALDTYAALGCNTVSMSFGELYTAMQLGTIDGVENDLLTLLSQNYGEVASHLSLVPVWPFASVTLVSKQTWDGLSASNQAILQEGIDKAIEVVNSEYANSIEGALDILREAGVSITEPADMQEFVTTVQPIYDKYLTAMDPELQQIAKNIMEMGKEF